ncbi:hypothetical protein I0C86_20860 [Plantactinospora sp. S1510]|uniref:Uncharacterized protein n=1 Tax=Plantactinospora alkalitolerans TaxID=2789879 RepID=A0ABS0GZN6_9ACTN|nr:hypothetical protein [Plantactinospora alkalitolerans]MBF9131394.1 hypothetical protein [Plantactinospora alkalitolerans]
MSYDEMNRTAVQALWNHMPDQPYGWHDGTVAVGLAPRQVTTLDIPEAWVAPRLRRLIRPFAQLRSQIPNSGPELEIVQREQYRLVQAEDLRAARFPNTFICTACGIFVAVRPGDDAPACPAGHGTLTQFQFAEAHNCGLLAELRPPQCTNRCRASMQLHNWRRLSVREWFWRCARCGARPQQDVIRFCTQCRAGRSTVLRVPQTSVHYPQSLTVLNPPTRTTYGALADHDARAAAVGQLIGVVEPGLEGLQRAVGRQDDALTQVQATVKALGLGPDDPLFAQLLEKARQSDDEGGNWRAQVEGLGLSAENQEIVGDEALALTLAGAASPLTIGDLEANPPASSLLPTYQRYRQLLDRYHLADVTLLRELPIAYVVAGYTRLSAQALQRTRSGDRTTWFKFFDADKSGKHPMYGKRGDTEGLLVRIDPLQIVRWLADSGLVPDPGITDVGGARRWLLGVCEPVVDAFNAPDHRITAAVLGLVHSMAHRFMKALAVRCGLHVESLAEYLFPSAGAFLIYANTRSEFTLGGIEHVFRFDLADALEELDADPRCVFDPPCRRSFGGACAACLHTSEVACERFNTVLDRNLLFGTLPAPAGSAALVADVLSWRGFWAR